VKPVMTAVVGLCRNRCCFRTKNGQIGIGLASIMVGDIITILLGCRTPIILRPFQDNTYLFIGETYCHGVMTAEALLGPLPYPFELVSRLGHAAFMKRDTGSFQLEDSRLGQLPLPPSVRTPKSPKHSSNS
jgi:hypothetical protein